MVSITSIIRMCIHLSVLRNERMIQMLPYKLRDVTSSILRDVSARAGIENFCSMFFVSSFRQVCTYGETEYIHKLRNSTEPGQLGLDSAKSYFTFHG